MQNYCPYSDTNGARSVRFINFTVQLEEYVHVLLFQSSHIKHSENNHFKVILSIFKQYLFSPLLLFQITPGNTIIERKQGISQCSSTACLQTADFTRGCVSLRLFKTQPKTQVSWSQFSIEPTMASMIHFFRSYIDDINVDNFSISFPPVNLTSRLLF